MTPLEWLIGLMERPDGYRRLMDETGSLAAAAWRLAHARCRASHLTTEVPSRIEVRAAARELATRLGLAAVPPSTCLADDCEALGLPVV